MTGIVIAWGVMSALVLALLVVARRGPHGAEWVVKPAAALTFVVTGLAFGGPSSTFGRTMIAGLCLAAVGDVLLIPKSPRAFLAGLGSFLLGHLAYAIAFVIRGVDVGWALGALVVLAIAAIPILRWLWPHVPPRMRGPVAAYIVVITLMVAAAAGAAHRDGAWMVLAGATLFYLSDLAVARNQFVQPSFVNRAWGLPAYFGAQMILAVQAGSP